MATANANITEYRYTAGPHKDVSIRINRQMRGVRITSHPNPELEGAVYDLPDFLKDYNLEHLELIDERV